MAQLRELNLDGTDMSDLGAEELLRSHYLDSTRRILCLKNRLSKPMARRLLEKFGSRLDQSPLSPIRP